MGDGPRVPKMSLALGQPQGCTGASLGCSRARDSFGTLQPSPEKTTRSFPYRYLGKSRNSALYQAIGIPIISKLSKRGWRTEGVGARKPLPYHRFGPFFCPLFLCPLVSSRTAFWGAFCAVLWALLVANPLPPTPFRNL